MTSQGVVTGVGRGWVSLRVELAQFPGLEDIYNEQWDSGRWLRRYRMEAGRCQIIDTEDNKQVRLSAEVETFKYFIWIQNRVFQR